MRDGIVCDATLNTLSTGGSVVPGVFAAGDVARWPNGLFDEEMRVEHWTNAAEQGALAATNLVHVAAGESPEPYEPLPSSGVTSSSIGSSSSGGPPRMTTSVSWRARSPTGSSSRCSDATAASTAHSA